MSWIWSYVLTLMGVTCFWLAGRKVWWAWYVGLVTQAVWLAYSLATRQWGFLGGVVLYTIVYVKNARSWTLLHSIERDIANDHKAEAELERIETAPPIEEPSPVVTAGTFRKKPLMVDARQWDGSHKVAMELLDWIGEDRGVYQPAIVEPQRSDVAPLPGQPAHLFVYCAEGAVEVFPTWWVVKEPGHIGGRAHTVLSPENLYDQLDLIEEG